MTAPFSKNPSKKPCGKKGKALNSDREEGNKDAPNWWVTWSRVGISASPSRIQNPPPENPGKLLKNCCLAHPENPEKLLKNYWKCNFFVTYCQNIYTFSLFSVIFWNRPGMGQIAIFEGGGILYSRRGNWIASREMTLAARVEHCNFGWRTYSTNICDTARLAVPACEAVGGKRSGHQNLAAPSLITPE